MTRSRNYTWEAEAADGTIIRTGPDVNGSLAGFSRYSLIPGPGVLLPRHDFIGAPLIRRFTRVFHKITFNSKEDLPGLVFWENGSMALATSADLREHLRRGDMVGKGVAGEDWYLVLRVTPETIHIATPYAGKSKPKGLRGRKIDRRVRQAAIGPKVLHCVELEGSRVWVDDVTGAVLVTDKDREVNL